LNAREFSLMAKNGLSPAQALIAGTANSAELLGLADQVGTLTAGKLADIIAVEGQSTRRSESDRARRVRHEGGHGVYRATFRALTHRPAQRGLRSGFVGHEPKRPRCASVRV
jgi:cytosine/adenosine deaminase-related metal-dependent hydrolase